MNTEKSMTGSHKAWADQAHAVHFDALSGLPGFLLRRSYERFNEIQLLNEALDRRTGQTRLLEVGCATGEMYRYLKLRHPRLTYTGCDISRPALERACQKYPAEGLFIETDVCLKAVSHLNPDILFCRDVAHHQPDPVGFIRQLYDMTQNLLVMRVRTRDVGETVRNPTRSCQFHAGFWVPYIVFNSQELLKEIEQFLPRPRVVHLVKHYMVLGGQHERYLPKDCYYKETMTAESALIIEKGDGTGPCIFREEVMSENLQLSLVSRALSLLARRGNRKPL